MISSGFFQFLNVNEGDLVFFHQFPKVESSLSKAIISSSPFDSYIFHVGIIVKSRTLKGYYKGNKNFNDNQIYVIHATSDKGVIVQDLLFIVEKEKPDFIEICSVEVDLRWKTNAALWALNEYGAEYNDLFSSNLINSRFRRSFYCCQLVSEAYKSTNPIATFESPFLPHKLNFVDFEGKIIPFWIEYYKKRCPNNPIVPQGEIGTHPSIIRVSPCIKLICARLINKPQRIDNKSNEVFINFLFVDNIMRNFAIPKNLVSALHFIDGARINIKSSSRFNVCEPRSGNLLTQCYSVEPNNLNDIIKLSANAQQLWAKVPWKERSHILRNAATLIRTHYVEIAEWEVRDNGKSITEAKADVLSCADTFEYFSGVDLSGEHLPYADSYTRFAYTRREPMGVVGAIGAWNYPFQTATWKIAPAIACGNSIIYKPSPLAPVSSVILALILQSSGLPDNVVNIIQGESITGNALCLSKLIQKVSFTGSIQTGRLIAANCAQSSLKPVTLELGGKSSCIIFSDCDLESAVNGALMANFYSQGQVCSNASKVIVQRSILYEFTERIILKTQKLIIGDPLNESTHIGASISLEHLKKVKNYINEAISEGAKLLYGGNRVYVQNMENGYYLEPCILSNITSNMKIYREEVFGAVLLIIPFDSYKESLQIANDTDTGLAAGIFTNDLKKAHSLASSLEAGNVYINTYNDVSPYVPFGGKKQSGYGRENGKAAIENYTQIKSVFVNASGKLQNPFP